MALPGVRLSSPRPRAFLSPKFIVFFGSGFFGSFIHVQTLTLVSSQVLSTQLSGDAQAAAAGALGPLVTDLSKLSEAWSSRSPGPTRWPWQATVTCTGIGLPRTIPLLAPGGLLSQCPRKT